MFRRFSVPTVAFQRFSVSAFSFAFQKYDPFSKNPSPVSVIEFPTSLQWKDPGPFQCEKSGRRFGEDPGPASLRKLPFQ